LYIIYLVYFVCARARARARVCVCVCVCVIHKVGHLTCTPRKTYKLYIVQKIVIYKSCWFRSSHSSKSFIHYV